MSQYNNFNFLNESGSQQKPERNLTSANDFDTRNLNRSRTDRNAREMHPYQPSSSRSSTVSRFNSAYPNTERHEMDKNHASSAISVSSSDSYEPRISASESHPKERFVEENNQHRPMEFQPPNLNPFKNRNSTFPLNQKTTNSTNDDVKRDKREKREARKEYRNALKLIAGYGGTPIDTLTEKEKEELENAHIIVSEFHPKKNKGRGARKIPHQFRTAKRIAELHGHCEMDKLTDRQRETLLWARKVVDESTEERSNLNTFSEYHEAVAAVKRYGKRPKNTLTAGQRRALKWGRVTMSKYNNKHNNDSTQPPGVSSRLKADRRYAVKLLKKYGDSQIDTLTERHREVLEWAQKIVSENNPIPNSDSIQGDSPTREAQIDPHMAMEIIQNYIRNSESTQRDSPSCNAEYNANFANDSSDRLTRSNGETPEGGFVLAVIDRNDREGKIRWNMWKWVEEELEAILFTVHHIIPGPFPRYQDAGWYNDSIKLVACADERSAVLYKIAVSKLGQVWPGACLEAIDKADIRPQQRLPNVSTRIPAEFDNPAAILRSFQTCNSDLPIHNWEINKLEEPTGRSRRCLLRMCPDSMAILERKNWSADFGRNTVYLKLCSPDEAEPAHTEQFYNFESEMDRNLPNHTSYLPSASRHFGSFENDRGLYPEVGNFPSHYERRRDRFNSPL